MKTSEEIIKEFREKYFNWSYPTSSFEDSQRLIEQFIREALERVREEALNEFYEKLDKEYGSFGVTKDIGKILLKLKANKLKGGD